MSQRMHFGTSVFMLALGVCFLVLARGVSAQEVLYAPAPPASAEVMTASDSVSPNLVPITTDETTAMNSPKAETVSLADILSLDWLLTARATTAAEQASAASYGDTAATPVVTNEVTTNPADVAPQHASANSTAPSLVVGKWIDVNISKQTITAYIGSQPIKTVLVSTGIARHPTVVGRFAVYAKLPSQTMTGGSRAQGDYYNLPGVPNIMYFYSGFAIHGTYWHRNFGHPMSHGCVNLTLADAAWFYAWTPMGTPVVTHY